MHALRRASSLRSPCTGASIGSEQLACPSTWHVRSEGLDVRGARLTRHGRQHQTHRAAYAQAGEGSLREIGCVEADLPLVVGENVAVVVVGKQFDHCSLDDCSLWRCSTFHARRLKHDPFQQQKRGKPPALLEGWRPCPS